MLATRLVRAADDEQYTVRHGLRALRQGLVAVDSQVELYPVSPTRRPTNVLVRMEVGSGTDPAALLQALRSLRRAMDKSGVNAAVKRQEYYIKPSERRRMKQLRARRRAEKVVRLERRREARGR